MVSPEKAFVNLFWGQRDAGFAAIQSRLRSSSETLEELISFYKQKLAVDRDYSKRLEKVMAATNLGSGETGTLKIALDKLQLESQNMLRQQQNNVQSINTHNLERLQTFHSFYQKNLSKIERHMQKILSKKKEYSHAVDVAKERYRSACGQIKSLTLLCQTTWGKELEKNTAKLSKLQQNLSSIEAEYRGSLQKYQQIHEIWVTDWSIALSSIYQLEIERIQTCKLNCFSFCNQIAALCVDWDHAADLARSSFASVGAPQDAYNFAEVHGTGNKIFQPPTFVDYLNGFGEEAQLDSARYTLAGFTDPDYSSILTRTFSTHSSIGRSKPPLSTTSNEHSDPPMQRRSGALNHDRSPITKSLPPILPQAASLSPPKDAGHQTVSALQKLPSHNSNYTSLAEDRTDVFDRNNGLRESNGLSEYSHPTSYSHNTNTTRSWASPRKRLVRDVQKEINRRLQDFSETLAVSVRQEPSPAAVPTPITKDFSIDFITQALEDLKAGGDGDMNKFRKSAVRAQNVTNGEGEHQRITASDLVDDSTEQARRYDSVSFSTARPASIQSKLRSDLPLSSTDNVLLDTVVRTVPSLIEQDSSPYHARTSAPEKRQSRASYSSNRSLLLSPTKSYINLQSFVNKVTPVTRNKYVTKAIARYSYSSREDGELSFRKGWHMYVVQRQEDNWYVCELGENCGSDRGKVGLVPYNYVREGDDMF